MKHDYSNCLSPEYTIPGLLASLLNSSNITAEGTKVDNIYAALGYDLDHVPMSTERIYRVQPASKSTSAAPVGLDFEIYVPDSFWNNARPPASGEIANDRVPNNVVRQADPLEQNQPEVLIRCASSAP